MRTLAAAAFLIFTGPALAMADCHCEGCGCKGGPGYRDTAGHCVGWKKLARTCGEPPTVRCAEEKAKQVCPSEARHPHQADELAERSKAEAAPRPQPPLSTPQTTARPNPF